ncbi:hypothetical protein BGX29_004665 [Mortierella sp. GBA35]|nr:hypothetical protein BGX29_004665 [Mortierella sp. GBA35]
MSCTFLKKANLDLIARTCSNLEHIEFYFDTSHLSYSTLERFFINLDSTRLTSISASTVVPYVDPFFLSSLSQLPNLTKLEIII